MRIENLFKIALFIGFGQSIVSCSDAASETLRTKKVGSLVTNVYRVDDSMDARDCHESLRVVGGMILCTKVTEVSASAVNLTNLSDEGRSGSPKRMAVSVTKSAVVRNYLSLAYPPADRPKGNLVIQLHFNCNQNNGDASGGEISADDCLSLVTRMVGDDHHGQHGYFFPNTGVRTLVYSYELAELERVRYQ